MGEMEHSFTAGQAEAFEALCSGRNVFLSGNAGTGKSYVLNAFIDELERREVPYLAMAPTGIAAQNLRNGTTIHRTLKIGFGVLDPHDENRKTLTRKVLNKAEVIIIDEISMCRVDLFERVMNMVLAAKRVSGRKQVVLVGDFFQLPPVVSDGDRRVLMQLWPGNDDGYAFKSPLWTGMGFEPHVLTEVKRQNDPEFIDQLNRARIGDRGCVDYFNDRSVSDRKRADPDDLWLCASNRMASTINDERVGELESHGARAMTYRAESSGDVKPSDKPTEDVLRIVVGARVMLLTNAPDHGLSNGSLGTVLDVAPDAVTVAFDDCPYTVEVAEKQWSIPRFSARECSMSRFPVARRSTGSLCGRRSSAASSMRMRPWWSSTTRWVAPPRRVPARFRPRCSTRWPRSRRRHLPPIPPIPLGTPCSSNARSSSPTASWVTSTA